MKKILIILCLSFGAFANNASAKDVSIGVIDITEINKDAKVMTSLNKQKDKKLEEIQKEVEKKKSELSKKEEELKGKQALMDKDAFAKEVRSFQMEIIAYEQGTEKKIAAIEKAYIEALQKIQKNYLNPIVKEIGKDRGFQLVINAQTAIVLDKKLEITEEVIDALNDQIREIKL